MYSFCNNTIIQFIAAIIIITFISLKCFFAVMSMIVETKLLSQAESCIFIEVFSVISVIYLNRVIFPCIDKDQS